MRLTFICLTLFLSSCASMMEFDGDKNSRNLAKFLMDEVLNRPMDSLFAYARVAQDGKTEYVDFVVPDMVFYSVNRTQPSQCDAAYEGTIIFRVSRIPSPSVHDEYIVNMGLGRLRQKFINGQCYNEEALDNLVTYEGVVPKHYIHMGYIQNLISAQRAKSFPVHSFKRQCYMDKLTSPKHADRNRIICSFGSHPTGTDLLPNYFLAEQRSVLQSLKISNIAVRKNELHESFLDIFKDRLRSGGLAAAESQIRKIRSQFNSALKKEQAHVNRTHKPSKSAGDAWLGKAFAIGAVAGVAGLSDLSSSQQVDIISATAADVINDTGGTNLQNLKSQARTQAPNKATTKKAHPHRKGFASLSTPVQKCGIKDEKCIPNAYQLCRRNSELLFSCHPMETNFIKGMWRAAISSRNESCRNSTNAQDAIGWRSVSKNSAFTSGRKFWTEKPREICLQECQYLAKLPANKGFSCAGG